MLNSPISQGIDNYVNNKLETSPIQNTINNYQPQQTNFSDVQNRWNNLGSEGQSKFLSQLLPKKQTQKQYAPINYQLQDFDYSSYMLPISNGGYFNGKYI